jgi:hypothetical protein
MSAEIATQVAKAEASALRRKNQPVKISVQDDRAASAPNFDSAPNLKRHAHRPPSGSAYFTSNRVRD